MTARHVNNNLPAARSMEPAYNPCPDGHSDETFETLTWFGAKDTCCRRCGYSIRPPDPWLVYSEDGVCSVCADQARVRLGPFKDELTCRPCWNSVCWDAGDPPRQSTGIREPGHITG